MPYCERKGGAFRDWTEDDQAAELTLPLPADTVKKELVCIITADSLHVRHARLQKTLLRAEPLSGPVLAEESTWYLQGEVLVIVLAKQWRGETKSDQYWGASLVAKEGLYECYLTPKEVREAREARERLDKEESEERHVRVKEAQRRARALREQKAREREEQRRRAEAISKRAEVDDDDDAGRRQERSRAVHSSWRSSVDWWAIGLAVLGLVVLEVGLSWRRYLTAVQTLVGGGSGGGGGATVAAGSEDDGEAWI